MPVLAMRISDEDLCIYPLHSIPTALDKIIRTDLIFIKLYDKIQSTVPHLQFQLINVTTFHLGIVIFLPKENI